MRMSVLVCSLFLLSCSNSSDSTPSDTQAPADLASDFAGDTPLDSAPLPDQAASQDIPKSQLLDPAGCTGLFGFPNEKNGVAEGLCQPSCPCTQGEFAPVYDAAFISGLREWTLLNPPAELTTDPYQSPDDYPRRDDEFCAVMVEDRAAKTYRLQTFASMEELEQAGGIVTHTTACGVCSSLATLALLIEQPDQTEPVRECGMLGLTGDMEKVTQCLQELGYERPCAQINAYNTANTRVLCGSICMPLLNAPYQNPDGTLNDCLQCDEEKSGDIFRAVAGRARRNSGVAAELCRPCEIMTHIVHAY